MPNLLAQTFGTSANRDRTDVIGTGNGGTTFNLNTPKGPVFLLGFQVKYFVSATEFTATADAAGNLTGTHLTSGTVTAAGAVTLNHSTAPDGGTDITAVYTTKGVLQIILDFITTNQDSGALDTGTGAATSFSGTLSLIGTVAPGQLRIRWQIDNQNYETWLDASDNFVHATITTGTFNRTTGAWVLDFTEAPDNGIDIEFIYAIGAEGQDWLVLTERLTQDNNLNDAFPSLLLKEVLITNSGKSYNDRIYIGLREAERAASAFYGIQSTVYKYLDDNGPWMGHGDNYIGQGGHFYEGYDGTEEVWTQMPTMAMDDDDGVLWLYANKNRLINMIRTSGTVYTGMYVGMFLRFGTPSEYNQPVCAIASGYSDIGFGSLSTDHKFFINWSTGAYSFFGIDPDGVYGVGRASTGETVGFRSAPMHNLAIPTENITLDRSGKVSRYEIYVYRIVSYQEALGQLEGPVYCPSDTLQSEDTLTDGGDTYDVFQNVFRANDEDYMAILRE